eukprot:m.519854 g.519854  ORF g.519854 m.519854 type:complete len:318 (+) comp57491_c1_seq4:168-1121(+)
MADDEDSFFLRLSSTIRRPSAAFATARALDKGTQLGDMRKSRRYSLEIGGLAATRLAQVHESTQALQFEQHWIDDNAFAVRWGAGLVRVSAIQRIVLGQRTASFRAAAHLADCADRSFSILYLPRVQDAAKRVLLQALNADFDGAFREADADGDGTLSAQEVCALLHNVSGVMPSSGELHRLFASIDANGDGTLTIDELRSWRDSLVLDIDVQCLDLVVEDEADLQRWVQKLNALVTQCEHRLMALRRGTFMTLVTPTLAYPCKVTLTPTLDLVWTPLSADTGAAGLLPLSAVRFLRIGQQTQSFRQAQDVAGESQR